MKRKRIVKLVCTLLLVVGCNSKQYIKETEIGVSYVDEDKEQKSAKAVLENDLNLEMVNNLFYDKNDKNKQVDKLVVGDILEAHYKDEEYTKLDKIYVDKINVELCNFYFNSTYPLIERSVSFISKESDYKKHIENLDAPLYYVISSDFTAKCIDLLDTSIDEVYVAFSKNGDIKALYDHNPR